MRKIFQLVGEITIAGMEAANKKLKAFDADTMKVIRTIDKFGKTVSKVGMDLTKNLTAPLVAVAGAMTLAATKTGDYADKLTDLADITGLSTDTLQEMEKVARTAGVEFEGLVGGITKLTNSMPDIVNGTGPAAKAVEALGGKLTDSSGHVRDMNTLFPELLDKLRGVQNVTERNALAQDIFGKSLADIAPVLGMTTQQFEDARKQAHDLGMVMSGDALQSAADFKVSMETLKAQFDKTIMAIGSAFIPLLQDTLIPMIQTTVVPVVVKFAAKLRELGEWFNGLPQSVKETIIILGAVAAAAGPVVLIVGKLIPLLKFLPAIFALCSGGMTALNTAMRANVIGIVITAIGLLVTAGIVLYKNWDLIKRGMLDAWDAIVYGVHQSISFLKQMFFSYIKFQLDGLALLTGSIPVIGNLVKAAQNGMQSLIEKEKESRLVRKELREETEAHKKELREAEEAVNRLKKAEDAHANTQVTDINLTNEQAEAAKRLKEKRIEFEYEWTQKALSNSEDRIVQLERERIAAIEDARRVGAETLMIELYYSKEKQKVLDEEAKKVAEKEKEKLDKRRDYETKWNDSFLQATLTRSELLEYEKAEALAKAEELGASKVSIFKYYAEQEKQIARDTANNYLGLAQNLGSQLIGIFQGVTDNRIMQIDQELQKKKDAITQEAISEEEKKAKFAKLEEEADKKKVALQRAQAKREKAAAIFSIIISTAQAIMMAVAQLGPIAGAIAGIAMGLLGAAQIAVVASKPLPMAEGGLVKKRQGGVNTIIGEGKEDEIVIPLKTGIKQMVAEFVDQVQQTMLPVMPQMQVAGAAGSSGSITNHWHIGTLIADDLGIKELERRQSQYRAAELKRRGGD